MKEKDIAPNNLSGDLRLNDLVGLFSKVSKGVRKCFKKEASKCHLEKAYKEAKSKRME